MKKNNTNTIVETKKSIKYEGFLNNLKKILLKKKIITVKSTIVNNNNKLYYLVYCYFGTRFLRSLKKIIKKRNINTLKTKNNNDKVLDFINQNLNVKKHKLLLIIKNYNLFLNTAESSYVYKKFRFYIKAFFSRRIDLFYDFIKISLLTLNLKIHSVLPFLEVLLQVFYVLPKKKHFSYLFFIKEFFIKNYKSSYFTFKGCNLIVKGKFKNKTKKSTTKINIGSIPNYVIKPHKLKKHCFTRFGCFGFTLSII